MANEIRYRQNFIGGLIDTSDLSASGTTMNSAGLASVTTAITSTNHMPITLDPDGIYGAPEIAYITALTVGATSCTLLRGQEGTTARQHLMDTPWVHAPTKRDYAGSFATAQHTANITFAPSSAGVFADLCTDADVTVAAQVGDWLEVAIALEVGAAANPIYFDVATRVGGSAVNLVGGGTNAAWRSVQTGIVLPIGNSVPYQVVSGDLSGGTVTLRMRATCDNTSPSRTVSYPRLTVKNLGAQVV